MKTEPINGFHWVKFGEDRIEFRLRRRKRKTLAITVRADTSVLVTAPRGAAVDAVRTKVRARAVWIRQQQAFFRKYLPPTPPRRYVSGETHRYLGRQYRLKVVEAAEESVKLKGRFIFVHTKRRSDTERVRSLVDGWYASHARAAFQRSLDCCHSSLRGRVSSAPRLRLRRMPNRWGSWTQKGDIYLNPELVFVAPSCIDYVVTHELCHLVHHYHSPEFYGLLRKVMPDWEIRKTRLESAVVA